MNVEVKYRLPGAGADIEHCAVSVLDIALARNLRSSEMTAAYHFGVGGLGFLQSGKVFLGNDEDVRGRFGIDVFKGKNMIVFQDLLCRKLAAEDAAEEAIGIGHRGLT
jgi:hypothetical protein